MDHLLKDKIKDVEQRAYFKWLDANQPQGMSEYFWSEAEKEIRAEVVQEMVEKPEILYEWSISPEPGTILAEGDRR
tara:strand:+ start:504 stop:731 length:228 start_codon:yes stop_codon:yes gene_type:complete